MSDLKRSFQRSGPIHGIFHQFTMAGYNSNILVFACTIFPVLSYRTGLKFVACETAWFLAQRKSQFVLINDCDRVHVFIVTLTSFAIKGMTSLHPYCFPPLLFGACICFSAAGLLLVKDQPIAFRYCGRTRLVVCKSIPWGSCAVDKIKQNRPKIPANQDGLQSLT